MQRYALKFRVDAPDEAPTDEAIARVLAGCALPPKRRDYDVIRELVTRYATPQVGAHPIDPHTGRGMPADVIANTHPAIRAGGHRFRCTGDRLQRLIDRGAVAASGPLGGDAVTDAHHTHPRYDRD